MRTSEGAFCLSGPARVEPGVIFHVEGTRFPIGELDGARSERCAAISAALVRAGLKAPIRRRIRDDIWLKLLGNSALNPLSGLTGAMLHEIGADPAPRSAAKAMMEDCAAVARRWLGGWTSSSKLSVDQRLDAALRIPDHKTSMLVDLESGREPELDPVVGAVIEIARLVSVDTPRLELAYACVKLLDRTRRTPSARAPGPAATAAG
ncbi:MAG: hypothetical protein M3O91_02480 [Chloroflexota bacterium]|nr:hypothetical protein [Chloroflexota bacterium]